MRPRVSLPAAPASEPPGVPDEPPSEPAPSAVVSPPAVSATAKPPLPASVRAAVEAYFAGSYGAAVELLDVQLRKPAMDEAATFLARLTRGAARYALYLLGGESEAALHDAAADDLRAARLLRPGGRIRLRVPSYLHLVERLLSGDYDSEDHHKSTIHLAYGTQAHAGDFHLTCFTPLTLREHLHRAGLGIHGVDILDGWMFEVVAVKGSASPVDPARVYGSRWRFVWRIARSLVAEKLRAIRAT